MAAKEIVARTRQII